MIFLQRGMSNCKHFTFLFRLVEIIKAERLKRCSIASQRIEKRIKYAVFSL